MAHIPAVTDVDFQQEVLESEIPVVVDFMAPWCGPCKMIAPILKKLEQEYSGRVKFVELDTDQYSALSAQYGVQKIPNLTFFKNGEIVDQLVGFLSAGQITQSVEKVVE
jgi:thioredoxin 1